MQIYRTVVSSVVAGILAIAVGCSDRGPQEQVSKTSQPTNEANPRQSVPEKDSQESIPVGANDQTLIATVAAGGIPTQYVAYFEQDKLTRIEETRQRDKQRGIYEFYGARLMKYSGTALDSTTAMSVQFSLQGAIESSQYKGGAASEADISAIRSRGQLLRSHALAQRSTHSHSMQ